MTGISVIFYLAGFGMLSLPVAEAAITTNTSATALSFGQSTIKASSPATPMIGLDMVQGASETFNSIKVELNGMSGFVPSDLATMATDATSGIALYQDNKSSGVTGSFDAADTVVTLSSAPSLLPSAQFSKLTPSATALVTDSAMTITTGDIAYTNVSANPTGTNYAWHMVTTGATGVNGSGLRLDGSSAAPTYVASTQFSKLTPSATAAVASGIATTTGDIVFADASGNAAPLNAYAWHMVTAGGAANAGKFDGSGSAATFVASTQISKLTPDATGAFVISGTSAITGNYTSPAVGDLVLYQNTGTTNAAQWGVITNATLTSGTFAVNGSVLAAGTWQISKVSTSFGAATAATNDAAMTITAGDLALALTTNNPMSDSYGWHIATSGATGVTGTALRIDGATSAPIYGWVVTLTPASGQPVPANDTGANAGSDYYVVVKTASGAVNGHAFSVGLLPGDVTYSANTPTATPTAFTTSSLTIDTVAPTVSSSNPMAAATNIPVSSFVHVNFSKNMASSTINPSNITFNQTTSGGPCTTPPCASPFSLRVYPNGFDLVPSAPPAYTASSRWSKPFANSQAFYAISGTNPINPQGQYVAPVAGDIVFYQQGDFPGQLGVITNATLTAGTFTINDLALQGGYQITKLTTPNSTGLISSAASLTTGDIVVAMPTANPAGTQYAFHLVTTGAASNSSNLRLDGASSAPTIAASSRVSDITPTHTSAVGASGNTITSGIALAQGDLLFANVTAGSSNLNQYAWHLVTTAETVGTGAAPSALRLDGGGAAPTFAASSQISSLTPAATGLASDSSPTFNIGDVVLASLTGGGQNIGSYAFHQVSGSGVPNSVNLRFDNASSPLVISATYGMAVGTGVTDAAGNALAAPFNLSFTTGSTGTINSTPPFVTSSVPAQGAQAFPIAAAIQLTFSQPMSTTGGATGTNSVTNPSNVGLFLNNFGAPGASVSATNSYNTTTNTLTITPASALSASTGYIVTVGPNTQSSTGTVAQGFFLNFMSAAGADTTKPNVLGVFPSVNNTSVALPVSDISIGFSKAMDASTITSSNVTLTGTGSPTFVVSYDPSTNSAHISPTVALATSTTYTVTVSSSVHDLSGNQLAGNGGVANAANTTPTVASNYVYTFATTSTADTTAPTVAMSNADNFSIAITFSKGMKTGGPNGADNIQNYALESPVGTSLALSSQTVTYDAPHQTAKITGLSMQNGVTYKVTVGNLVQDLAGNAIDTTGTPAHNVAQGTVQNATMTGGQLGPGSGTNPMMQNPGTFGMTPTNVMPMTRLAGATSSYHVAFPVAQSIPLGGTIVLTFPSGFDVTNAVAATAGTESFANSDLNGPAAGVVTIASVADSNTAHTITITTAGAATGAPGFINLDLKAIVNSTVPSSTGYTVTITTRDASNVQLESMSSAPFFLGTAGSDMLTVNVFHDDNSNGTKDSGEGIGSATVFLFSPGVGGQSAVTTTGASGGVATFSSLTDGSNYMVGVDPSTTGSYVFNPAPQPLTMSGNTTKNFILTAAPYTISGTVYGPASTSVDVFGAASTGSGGFVKTTVSTNSTPATVGGVTYGGSVAYSLPVSGSTTYSVGVGPSMPTTAMMPGSPPPPPASFTFMPPANISVAVAAASVSAQNFTLTTAGNTITGSVLSSTGGGVASAQVFARPAASSTGGSAIGFGTGAQTDTTGAFTLNVVPGLYMVSAFKPGMPQLPEQQITVASGGNTPTSLTFKFSAGTSLTITGQVTDQSGNAVPYAGVSAHTVTSSNNLTPLGGGSNNFVGGPTDSNGNYTLYVSAGTWVVDAFAPGFGHLGSKTVTVSTTNVTGQNFSAQTLSLGTITGQATKATVAQQGVMVHAFGSAGDNMAVTDTSGNYSLNVPAGTYTVSCFFPGVGDTTPLTGVAVTANTTTSSQNCGIAAPITITVNLTDGTNPITNAFVGVQDANGHGNGTNLSTTSGVNAVYVVNVPPGTYTVRADSPQYGPLGSTASVSTTQAITYTASAGVVYAVSGTVTAGGTGLSNAWVSLNGTPTGSTNVLHMGAQTNSSGAYSISVPNGTYQLRADKPGYVNAGAVSVVVNGSAVAASTISVTASSRTISGTVTLNSSGVASAFVDANNGAGGFAVAQTDSTGAYTLSVNDGTWTLNAHSQGYSGGPTTVTVSGSNVTGQAIILSAISGFTPTADAVSTVTPSAGGTLTNSIIGSQFKVNVPANALGTGSNAATLTTNTDTSVPNASSGSVLTKDAVKISAVNSSGQAVTSLNSPVTITVPYNTADLPAGTSESNLVLGTWNTSTQSYDTLPTTVDTTNHTLTATVSHFSDFAPLAPTNGSAPATPTGFSVSNTGTGTSAALTWTASSGATSYDVYRSTDGGVTFPLLASGVTTTSYTAVSLATGATYQFKVSAVASGNESAATSAASVTISIVASGGGGGGGGGSTTTTTTTTTTTVPSTTTGSVAATAAAGGTTTVATTVGTTAGVSIPAAALSADATVTVAPEATTSTVATVTTAVAAVPSTVQVVGGNVYDYKAQTATGSSITSFNANVTLTFTYTDAQVSGLDVSSLAVEYFNTTTNAWVAIPGTTVNTATHTITVPVNHFTLFAVFGTPTTTTTTTTTPTTTTTTTTTPTVSVTVTIVDGDIIKTADNPDVYIIKIVGQKLFRRHILNPEIFNSYGQLKWSNIKVVSQDTMNQYTISYLIMAVNPNGTPVSGRVYKLTETQKYTRGIKQWLHITPAKFEKDGYDWDAIYKINTTEASSRFYPTGVNIVK